MLGTQRKRIKKKETNDEKGDDEKSIIINWADIRICMYSDWSGNDNINIVC